MCAFAWSTPLDCSGIMHHSKSYTHNIYFQWAPSIYYQQPTRLLEKHKCAVIHMSAWDMGTYYKGDAHWEAALLRSATTWAAIKPSGVFWLRLHKLSPDSCKDAKCRFANKHERAFRAMADKVMAATGIIVIDANVTDPTPPDATHYSHNATLAEAKAVARVLAQHGCLEL